MELTRKLTTNFIQGPDIMANDTFGRYEIRGELGRGGMATVYHAFDPHVQRHVALKILPRVFMHDEHFRERFIREARAIAALEHWAIVPLHDYGEQDEQPFFVMRFMPGGSLLDRIHEGRLSLDEVVPAVERIAAALDFAHRKDVIHRDVKPANILFDEEGDAYLSDFGIVKLTEATAQLTGSGIVGTPTYMAPEMVHRGGVTSLIDVYALGVTLFQALTGDPPYEADTPMGTALAHTTKPIPTLSDWRLDLPTGMQAVIDGALAKDPADRYQSAGALAADLRGVASQGQAQPAPPPAVETTLSEQAPAEPTLSEPTPPAAPEPTLPEAPPATSMPLETPGPQAPPAPPAVRPAPKRGFPIWVVGVLAVVGLAVVLGLALTFWPRAEEPAQEPVQEPATERPVVEPEQPTPLAQESVQGPPEDPWGVVEVGPDQPILIAVNVAVSGAVPGFGLNQLRAAEIAAGGGIMVLGHGIELVPGDTACNPDDGLAVARQTVANPSIVAVVGHTCSTSCMPAAEVYEEAHYTMVSPSCTAGDLTSPDMPRAFMRTAPNDHLQGQVAADYAYHVLGARRAATLHDRGVYGAGLVVTFAEHFSVLGGEVVAQEALDVGDQDIRPQLRAIAAQEPDVLYFPLFPGEGSLVAIQSLEVAGLGDVIRIGSDALRSDAFIEGAGGAAEGVYASSPALVEGPGYLDYLHAYTEAYGEEPPAPFGPESHDALKLILRAIEAVGTVSEDGTLYIPRQALREAMYSISFEGISGQVECSDLGDCSTAGVEFAQVQNGEFIVVETQ
jgi:branched-chain amino acid transport system substrate-binding protein